MEWFGGSEVPLFSNAKAAKGRRTGALSSGCSRDAFQAATTSRDTLSCNAVRTKVPRPLHRDAKTLNLRAEALGTESPRGALFCQAPNRHKTPQAHLGGPGRPATPKAPEPGVPHREALPRLPPIPNASSLAASPGNELAEQRRRKTLGLPLIGLPPPRRARQRLAAGRCQSPRPEPSPGKRSRARVLRLPPRPLKPVQLGELERAPPPPRLPTLPRRRRCRSCRRTPWRGGRENGARGGGGGGEVMLAPGMGQRQRSSSICATQAAASLWPEGQPSGGRPRAPRVRSGPAVRAPARGPPGLSLVVTRLIVPGHSDKGVWDPDRESGRTVRLMLAPVPLLLVRSPLRADRL